MFKIDFEVEKLRNYQKYETSINNPKNWLKMGQKDPVFSSSKQFYCNCNSLKTVEKWIVSKLMFWNAML